MRKNRNSTKRKQIRWNLLIFSLKKPPKKRKTLPARAKNQPKKRVGRAPFFSKQFGVHADFFFENRGLFPRKSFRELCLSAGTACAKNRVSGAPFLSIFCKILNNFSKFSPIFTNFFTDSFTHFSNILQKLVSRFFSWKFFFVPEHFSREKTSVRENPFSVIFREKNLFRDKPMFS